MAPTEPSRAPETGWWQASSTCLDRLAQRARVMAPLLFLVAAACGGNGDDGPRLADEQPETTTTTTEPEEGEREEFVVGDRVMTQRGNEATLYAYEQPVDPEFATPEPGNELAVADYETCARVEADPTSDGIVFIASTSDMALVFTDNTRVQPTFVTARSPEFPRFTEVYEDECIRGWITFEVPAGERPVSFRDGGAAPPLVWAIP